MIKTKKLDSGLTLIQNKIAGRRSVSMGIFIKAGSRDEERHEQGISHLLEHMHFKGTKESTQKELIYKLEAISGYFNAYTSKELTCYYMKMIEENAEKAADLLLDMMLNSTFDAYELEREKKVVIQEMRMTKDNPEDHTFVEVEKTIYKDTNYEGRILGTEESVSQITREMLFDYKKRHYAKDDIVLAILSGEDDYGLPQVFEEALQGLNRTAQRKPEKKAVYTPRYFSEIRDLEQGYLVMAMPGTTIRDYTNLPNKMANMILGGGMCSRLFQRIREEQGLAYSVYSSEYSLTDTGLNFISAGLTGHKLEEALKSIKKELELFKDKGVTEDEFKLAKEKAKAGIVFLYEDPLKELEFNAKRLLLIDKIETLEDKLEQINKITIEDVNREAAKIGTIENYTIGLIANKEYDIERILNS